MSPPSLPSSCGGVQDLVNDDLAVGDECFEAVASSDTANLCVVDATGIEQSPEGGDAFAAVLG